MRKLIKIFLCFIIALTFTGCSIDWNSYGTAKLEASLTSIQTENANLDSVISAYNTQLERTNQISQITQTTMKANLIVEYCYFQRIGLQRINETYYYSNGFIYYEDAQSYYACVINSNYDQDTNDYLSITIIDCYNRAYDGIVNDVFNDYIIIRFTKPASYPLLVVDKATFNNNVGDELANIGTYNDQMNYIDYVSVSSINSELGQVTMLSTIPMLGFIVDSDLCCVGICISSISSGQYYTITVATDYGAIINIS